MDIDIDRIPVLRTVYEMGADDRVFDSLILVAPVLVVVIGVLGRNSLTTALGVSYIGAFLVNLLRKALRKET
ncbi:MAG: hypothetical protein SV253_08555 [Halobacteria archaeon]|nr:hypothetical protein [Halobacteria archaeon]